MSSSAPTSEWLVQVPDFPGSLQKRLDARPQHLAGLKPKISAGEAVFGGATLSKQPVSGETPDMTGSVMLFKANSEEEVLAALENDPYTKAGVWDVKNAKIWPFKCAVRTAL
ncbi:hypothetical protein LTR10_016289 [Elasticomyces elasticus]|uniref:YCII-related domain-containing protein n=1 Tax=Exophiala sideris TaxID=1016849 RepID=A0ABR0J5L1_9EURO|nr:hypothetical protein LTR10_016289 [Elasticomyces elasticus]KAK5028298.1 hypothetical protein LTS07_006389 [Exophiala sideris]KAK5036057.1 hypothetical protein LTR13_005627 [Exophiala sideris]KAK5057094.1 hypothetical protein LTR69_007732 [Exophiala sideris]KAK5181501.1 hypothetical protein LTR44_006296 [Eurotiomycetes sp. CCFEE 6388]